MRVECLQRRTQSKSGEFTLVNTKLHIATFDCNVVSNRVLLLGKNVFLWPFVQRVRRCIVCQSFRYSSRFCHGDPSKSFCDHCTHQGRTGLKDPDTLACINCARTKLPCEGHTASDSSCPCYTHRKMLRRS